MSIKFIKKYKRNVLTSYKINKLKDGNGILGASGYALLEFKVMFLDWQVGTFKSITHDSMDVLYKKSKDWDYWIETQGHVMNELTENPTYRFS